MTWELRLGDCLDPVTGLASLADKSVDHVICDPPYEAEAHTKQRRILKGSGGVGVREAPLDFAAMDPDTRARVAEQMARVARGWVICFCQVEGVSLWRSALEASGARWRRAAIWLKPDGMPQLTGDRPAQVFETIACAWSGEGKSRWNGGGRGGVYTFMTNNFGRMYAAGGRPHPTAKPEPLMDALVKDFTDPDETICDPFAGSGTTGVAAIRLGRRFIGWERDPKYHAAAMKRLNAAREQMDMFERRVG